jgi:Protein involved in formate dehydrogenase formation
VTVGLDTAASPWTARAGRAEELRARHPFAAEVLTLYLGLLPVQEDAWRAAGESAPAPAELAAWAAANVLPAVVDATAGAGPPALCDAAGDRFAEGAGEDALAGWLAGEQLEPIDHYLARASLAPVLEALGAEAGAACAPAGDGATGSLCPCCGGLPQVSCVTASGEALVSGRRKLLCARCGSSWDYTRSACPACGEADEDRLLVYTERWAGPVSVDGNGAEPAVFPHMRITGCENCRRYLIEVDMAQDGRAVPEVDELAALPLDLYAADQGLTKVTPNLMGF